MIIDGGELGAMQPELGLYALADEVVLLDTAHGDRQSEMSTLVDLLRHQKIKARAVLIDPASHAMAA